MTVLTKQLEDAVIKARNNDDWRVKYMNRLSFFKNRKLKANKEDIEQDGGITKKTNIDAPKHIESTLIIRFAIEMSTVADCEENEYCGYVYNLNAALENGAVKGHYECRNRYGLVFEQRFRSSVRFMSDLNRIVTECNLARYNGESSFVAGLPDNYGALVDIMYASGEHIYASDNASNFIPNNAVKELVDLFESHAISASNWTKMEFSRNHSNWEDCFCVYIRRDDLGDMFAEGYLVSNGEEYSFDEEISISTEAVDALNSMKLSSLPKSEKSPRLPQADDEPVQKLILSYNHREVSKKLDNNTFDHIYNILLTEFIKHQ